MISRLFTFTTSIYILNEVCHFQEDIFVSEVESITAMSFQKNSTGRLQKQNGLLDPKFYCKIHWKTPKNTQRSAIVYTDAACGNDNHDRNDDNIDDDVYQCPARVDIESLRSKSEKREK